MKISLKKVAPLVDTELPAAVARFRATKAALDAAKDQFDKAQHELLTIMRDRGHKTTSTEVDGRDYSITMVSSERTKVNEEGLREAVGEAQFVSLCDQKVSLTKIQSAINSGHLPLEVFAAYATVVETSPYIKVTETHDTAK